MKDSEKAKVFSNNLQRYMKLNNLRKIDLARLLNVRQSNLTDWTGGKTVPKSDMLLKMMNLFGCDISDLLMPPDSFKSDGESQNELSDLVAVLKRRPECRELLIIAKDLSKSDIEKAIRIFGALKEVAETKQEEMPQQVPKQKKPANEVSSELPIEEQLFLKIDNYLANHPFSNIPQLPNKNLKPGEFVRTAFKNLARSKYKFSDDQLSQLCDIKTSRKYTSANHALLLPVGLQYDHEKLARYWTSPENVITLNGKQYYVFSQWYAPNVKSKAHLSDFLEFYLELVQTEEER